MLVVDGAPTSRRKGDLNVKTASYTRRLELVLSIAATLSVSSGYPQEAAFGTAVPIPTEIGPNYRSWIAPKGAVLQNNAPVAPDIGSGMGKVVEIATGMNYWDGQAWVKSDPVFDLAADGFSAPRVQDPVFISANLNQIEAVTLVTPDGLVLKSTPVAIGLYNAASGDTLMVGTIKDCSGVLVGNDTIVFKDAFDGVCANIVYVLTQGSFEQDVVFTGRFDPRSYGFPVETTQVQIYTEFYETPNPDKMRRPLYVEKDEAVRKQMVTPDLVDEVLGFGEFVIGPGRVFTDATQANPSGRLSPTAKELRAIDGRTFLIESVRYKGIQQAMDALPDCAVQGAAAPSKLRRADLRGIHIPKPSPLHAKTKPRKEELHAGQQKFNPHAGVVIDYLGTIGGTMTGATVFRGDTTYLVSSTVYCNGPTTIEGGAVFKYKSNTAIYLYSTLTRTTSAYREAIFTAVDDDSVGESMEEYPNSGYTGTISSVGYALPALYLRDTETFSYFRFSYAKEAVRYECFADYGILTIMHSQFVNCVRGIYITGSGATCGVALMIHNSLFSGVGDTFKEDYSGLSPSLSLYQCTVHNSTEPGQQGVWHTLR